MIFIQIQWMKSNMLSVAVCAVSNHHAVRAPRVLIGDTRPRLMLRLHSQGESVLEKGKMMEIEQMRSEFASDFAKVIERFIDGSIYYTDFDEQFIAVMLNGQLKYGDKLKHGAMARAEHIISLVLQFQGVKR